MAVIRLLLLIMVFGGLALLLVQLVSGFTHSVFGNQDYSATSSAVDIV